MTSALPKLAAPFIAWLSLAAASPACAQILEPFSFGVFAHARYDSNLFRLPDGVQPGGSGDRSAFSETTGLTIKADETYGLQHVVVDASVMRDFYTSYGNLDYTGNRIGFTYNWSLTPSITGNLILSHSNLPTDFAYSGYLTSPDPTRSDLRRLDVDVKPGGALHPRVSIYQEDDRTTQPLFQQQSSRSTSLEASLIYEFRSGNTAEIYARRAKGDSNGQFDQNFATLTDPEFTEYEYGLRAKWEVTGLSKLDGKIGYLRQTHPTFGARNFDGVVGNVEYVYTISGKTSIQINGGRSVGSSQTLFSNYLVDESVTASAIYKATEKITARAVLGYGRRRFEGSPFANSGTLVQTTRSATLAVDWAVLRAVDLSLALVASNRTSNDNTFQYDERAALITGVFKF